MRGRLDEFESVARIGLELVVERLQGFDVIVFEEHLDADAGDGLGIDEIAARRVRRIDPLLQVDRVDVSRIEQGLAGIVDICDRDFHFVFADPDPVAREQALRLAVSDGVCRIVDEHAVLRGVDDVIAAGAKVDARMPARHEAMTVGQAPVGFERTADRAAGLAESHIGFFAERLAVPADDFEGETHNFQGV